MELVSLQKQYFKSLFNFETENKNWFEQWVPPRPEGYFEFDNFEHRCNQLVKEMADGEGHYFLGVHNQEVIGRFNLVMTNSTVADIGYRVAEKHVGKGYAFKFSEKLMQHARDIGVEAVTAEALVENEASNIILKKLGFIPTEEALTPVSIGTKNFMLASYRLFL